MAVSLERDSGVGIIKLNNPPANAYDHAVMKELDEAIYQIRFDPAVSVFIVPNVPTTPRSKPNVAWT